MKKIIIAFVLSTLALLSFAQGNSIIIGGSFNYLTNKDSIVLRVRKYFDIDNTSSVSTYKVHPKKGIFSFKIPSQNYPQYVDLMLPNGDVDSTRNLSLYGYLVENGDSVQYSDKFKDRIVGIGAEKWHIKLGLMRIEADYMHKRSQLKDSDLKNLFLVFDSCFLKQLEYVSHYKKSLSPQAYALMKANSVSSTLSYKQYYIWLNERRNPTALIGFSDSGITDSLLNTLAKDTTMFYSNGFVEAVISKYRIKQSLNNKKFELKDCYEYMINTYQGNLGERIIVSLLLEYMKSKFDITPLLKDALLKIKDENLNVIIRNLISAQGAGSEAYDFQLQNSAGELIKLSDFKGKTVVLDFWYTGCIGCAALAPTMKKVEQEFQGKNVIFITISIDKSKEKWLNSLKHKIYTSEYTLDLYTGGEGESHHVIRDYMVNGYPTIIAIDTTGRIMRNIGDPIKDKGKELIELINNSIR